MAEIDAGTPQAEMARAFQRYQSGGATPIAEARQNGRKATQREIFDAGVSLDADAREIMKAKKTLTYRQAFAEAQAMAPAVSATYNHGVKLGDADSGELKQRGRALADAYAESARAEWPRHTLKALPTLRPAR